MYIYTYITMKIIHMHICAACFEKLAKELPINVIWQLLRFIAALIHSLLGKGCAGIVCCE